MNNLQSAVFENPILMDSILDKVDGGLMGNLHIRLISKIFNDACLEHIRKRHVKVKIEHFPKAPRTFEEMYRDILPSIERRVEIIRQAITSFRRRPHLLDEFFDSVGLDMEDRIMDYLEEESENEDEDQDSDDDDDDLNDQLRLIEDTAWAIDDELDDFEVEEEEVHVHVNHKIINVKQVGGYLKFINQINTKVEKIVLRSLWKLEQPIQKSIHDGVTETLLGGKYDTIRSLIGMDDICVGCNSCRAITQNCKEYGPIRQITFFNTRTPTHFDRLVITNRLLESYADNANYYNKERFFARLHNDINANIRCDTLELQISETWSTDINADGEDEEDIQPDEAVVKKDHPPLPREVLELIIEKWEVKNLILKFCRETRFDCYKPEWVSKEFLTKFRFNDPSELILESSLKPAMGKVIVDLTESVDFSKGISENGTESYSNLITIIRKMFSTNHISINFSHWTRSSFRSLHLVLEKILDTVFEEDQRNLNIDIRYFARVEQFSFEEEGTTLKLSEIPRILYSQNRKWRVSIGMPIPDCYKQRRLRNGSFVKEKWVGRRFELRDPGTQCVVDWEVMVKDGVKEFSEELLRSHPNSYARHFIDN